METKNLRLISDYPDAKGEAAGYDGVAEGLMDGWPEDAAAQFIAALTEASAEPWVFGFSIVHKTDNHKLEQGEAHATYIFQTK